MRARGAPARTRRISLALSLTIVACTHDFSVFEPVSSGDAGSAASDSDAGARPDASGSTNDAAPPPAADAAPLGDGASCGSDCRIEALSCAGTCAQIEQSCAAACAPTSGTCAQGCLASENDCTSQCATVCETCTSGEGCLDQAGCAASAP
jgi:hypothetical protein